VCDENPCNPASTGALVNTLTTTTGTALNVSNTTIGANKLEFRSISADGATNGIVLNNTGTTAGLTVRGTGAPVRGGNGTGGTIQNTTGAGIALTNTRTVSLANMSILTTGGSGIDGIGVTNFAFTNGTISGAGNGGIESAIAFNGNGSMFGNNIAGTLTVTNNTITNPFYSGVDVQADNGTVTLATVSGNSIGNPGFSGVNLVGTGNASTAFNLDGAIISGNTITSTGGNGIQVSISNANTTGPGAHAGLVTVGPNGPVGDPNNIRSITGNTLSVDPTGTQAIAVANSGNRRLALRRTSRSPTTHR
jgi:hypothetical protein